MGNPTGIRYSQELKNYAADLWASGMKAKAIATTIKEAPQFKKEARHLSTKSVYRFQEMPKRAVTQMKLGTNLDFISAPVVDECLVSNQGESTTLTILLPTSQVGNLLKQLGF